MASATTTLRIPKGLSAKLKFAAGRCEMTQNALLLSALDEYIERAFPGLIVYKGSAYEYIDTASYDFDEYIQAALLLGEKEKAITFAVVMAQPFISEIGWDDRLADQCRKASPDRCEKKAPKTVAMINKAWPRANLPMDADVLGRLRAVVGQA